MHLLTGESRRVPKGTTCTGAAWLSSARVVRCWVKSRNERNPCELLPPVARPSTLFRLPCATGRKVGTTSSQYGPYGLGCTRTTMPSTERSETARWRKSIENWAQFGLEAAIRLHEAGIASNGVSATTP